MLNSKKVFTGKLGKSQQEDKEVYDKKVKKLKDKCEDFGEHYLGAGRTASTPADSMAYYFEIYFKDFMTGKFFSRTSKVLSEMDKQLRRLKDMRIGDDVNAFKKAFKYTPKKIDEKGYIKRSAIDNPEIAEFFNVTIPKKLDEKVANWDHDKEIANMVQSRGNFKLEIGQTAKETEEAINRIETNLRELLKVGTPAAKRNSKILSKKKSEVEAQNKRLSSSKKALETSTKKLNAALEEGNPMKIKQDAAVVEKVKKTVKNEMEVLEKKSKELENLNIQAEKIIKSNY